MNTLFYDMISAVRSVRQLYEEAEGKVASKYGLSKVESAVLAFLNNNPGRDTASDISVSRRIKKANVSVAVNALENKGFLSRKTDEKDRRVSHLTTLPPSFSFLKELSSTTERLFKALVEGFSEEEISQLDDLMRRLDVNARKNR